MTIAVGISGGVDSSVTAYLLKQQGHKVIGVTMRLLPGDDGAHPDARKVAEHLEIPFLEIDLTDVYKDTIISYIQQDYARGRTPNPCVLCNRYVKFGLFLKRLEDQEVDFDYFATGHYARIIKDEKSKRYGLKKGTFADKDQAYFLSLLTQEQLSRIMFPLGEMTKDNVRNIAAEAGLFTAKKQESQDLCIGGYRQYLDEGKGPGDFVTTEGKVIARHKGIENYTIGQRRGLGIGAGYPLYVIAIDTGKNQVIVGKDEELMHTRMLIRDLNWGFMPEEKLPLSGQMKIRYADKGTEASILKRNSDGSYLVEFSQPRRAITPGQLAVMYKDETVALAGIIIGQAD